MKCIKLFEKFKHFISSKRDIFFSMISGIVAITSLLIGFNALQVSEIALEISSQNTEPIIEMKIDYSNGIVNIKNKSHKYFQISNVNYGKVRFIGVMDDRERISHVYIPEKWTGITLEHGHTVGTDMSDGDIKRYNKNLTLKLDDAIALNEKSNAEDIESAVKERCLSSKYSYWDVSPYYTFYYIEVSFKDAYENRNDSYYIYKYEYGSIWQLYKLSKEEYIKLIENVYQDINSERIISDLFNEDNFELITNTEYINYYYDIYFPLYQKIGIE